MAQAKCLSATKLQGGNSTAMHSRLVQWNKISTRDNKISTSLLILPSSQILSKYMLTETLLSI